MKMYKLFGTRFAKQTSLHGVSIVQKQMSVRHTLRLCSFCNFYHRKMPKFIKYHQVHSHTKTVGVLNRFPEKKKGNQRKEEYTELLAVRNEKTNNERTKVRKITASNLSVLTNRTDVCTQDLYNNEDSDYHKTFNSQVEDKSCSDSFDRSIYLDRQENADTFPENNKMHGPKIDINDEVIDNSNEYNVVENTVEEEYGVSSTENEKLVELLFNFKMFKKQPVKKVEFPFRQSKCTTEQYITDLLACMQVYLHCGLVSKANKTLMKYRKCVKSKQTYSNDIIELYNVLLEVYASRKKYAQALELYSIIKMDSVTPTPQTYLYLFDALRNESNQNERLELLKKFSSEMNKYNISFNDIFTKCYFKNSQQEEVLKFIRTLMPSFKPSYPKSSAEYTINLLHKLRTKQNYESHVEGLFNFDNLKNLADKQLQNESNIETEIPNVLSCNINEDTLLKSTKNIVEIETRWKNAALAAFERNLKYLKIKENQSPNNLMILHPFLEVLDKEDYINAILRDVKQIGTGSESYSISLNMLYSCLGTYIYKKYEIKTKKVSGTLDKVTNIYTKYLKWYLHPEKIADLTNVNNRTVWQYYEQEEAKHGPSANITCTRWPTDIVQNIGKFLYNIILNDIILEPDMLRGPDLKRSIPAFYTLFRNKNTYLSEQIKAHPFVSKLYKESHLQNLSFGTLLLPTYCPPRPWTSINTGGYLTTKIRFIRIAENDKSQSKLKNTAAEQLVSVFDSLNEISSVPWKINTPILDIIIKIFQDGGSVKLNVPQSVSMLIRPPTVSKEATPQEKLKATQAMTQYKQKKYDVYSLWCDALYRLSIANHFRDKTFWLPHNLDFRGRTYPVAPHLNHLSSDLGRSLLLFAKGKPLGPNGLDWLKLHVINLTEFKKGSSNEDRLKFANENIDNILDSAAKPLTGKMWWATSENPWQTLAGCMEIAAALQAPNAEEYICSFPVHQDGSCNGLQHYAALGRDQIGAESVNLYPFDTPQDVYKAITSVVEQQRQTDALNNIEVAKVLEGVVKRKVIKQTVMTTVYGVTKYGARLQIAKQLKDTENFPIKYVWPGSTYLATCTFQTLETMFKSAKEIQNWFTVCARIISSICSENVEWITPMGLPIVQPYTKQLKLKKIKGASNEKPDTMKQRNAFAPNFIHSLDSTHMMLTSLYCHQENVTFVSVHDCFWTHPCSVEIMNRICREQFVALHSEPILENLSNFFVQRYAPVYKNLKNVDKTSQDKITRVLTKIPAKGTFDLKNVLSSTYFFH